MDEFDRAILRALQSNSRISTEQLGDTVGLSSSACQRRIKKLKTAGIIKKEVAVIDREKLESYTTAIVDVHLEQGGEKALDSFIHKLNSEKQVQQFYYTAGDIDFVLIIVVKDMTEFDNLTRKLLMSDSNVKKFHSKIVIQSPKVGLEVPI